MDDTFDKVSADSLPPASSGWHRLWRPFLAAEVSGGARRYRVRWIRLAAALAAGLAVLYALGAMGLFLVARYAGENRRVAYVDLLWPGRWPHFRAGVGDQQLERAAALFRHGARREAFMLARVGLGRSPANRDGRLLMARLLFEAGRPDAAQQLLLEGLAWHRDDPKFLHPLFTVLLQRQEDARVLAVARSLLPARPTATERDRLAGLAAATASYFRGDFDPAEDFLHRVPSLAGSRDGLFLAAKLDWARGYRQLALVSLRSLADGRPQDAEIHGELVRCLRQLGRRDEARRRSLAYQIAHPDAVSPRIELLRDLRESGETVRAEREIEALLRDFAGDASALLALADFAANPADPALSRRLLAHAQAHNLPWEPHALLVVEALVAAREYREALDTATVLAREHPDFATRFQPVLGSLQAIAHFGLDERDAGRLLLASFLHRPALRADNLLAVAQRLIDLGAAVPAHDALTRAVATDPFNQAALTRLVELDLNLNRIDALPAHLQRLVAMRQPSPDVLRVAQFKLGSDLFLFSSERPAALAAVRAALDRQPPARARL